MEKVNWWKTRKTKLALLSGILLSLPMALAWYILFYPYVSTDDARVAATTIQVAPLLQRGRIIAVHIQEGDRVKKGDLLVELDHEMAEAGLLRAKARLHYAERELNRYTKGAALNIAMQHDVDLMKRDLDVARSEFQIAKENLEDTYLHSPSEGIVIRNLADEGNLLEPGQTAVILANMNEAWISANIEETSIADVRPGQPVEIHVDEGFDLKGKVLEVIHATASRFSLIPSDNAQGNFTKVVQRIPIKVNIDSDRKTELRVGQSVELRVKVH